ncbi:hypothetical protein [Streptomyces sp. NPDC088794]|uniref:hypothetical protein n=1 Tax=Streptomyces sp. NPDC088794 TaxID=3365902 RepID=UPI00381996EA
MGQFIAGDNNNVYGVVVNASHSTVTVLGPDRQPKPVRRERIERLPRRGPQPLGRESELASVLRSVADNEPVDVYGPVGIGKSALVRQAVFEVAAPDGVVFLNGHGHDVDDILQGVFEACYDSPGHRPGEGELHRLLGDLRLCVAVDDLEASDRDLTRLLDTIPRGTLLISSSQRLLWGHGRHVELSGLSREAGLRLFARELRRPLHPTESANATALWESSQGHPFELIRAAALARPAERDGEPRLPAPAEIPTLLRHALAGLSDLARQMLSLFSAVPEAAVTTKVLVRLLPAGTTAEAVEESAHHLSRLALLTVTEQRMGLGAQVAEALPAELTLGDDQIAEAVVRLTEWVSARQTPPSEIADHAPLIGALVDAVSRAGRPELGVGLARAAAPGAACSLRPGAWSRVLTRGLTAAQQAGDRRAHAYFTHETGVRSLLTGERVAAATAFAAAALAWHTLGDQGSAAMAEHAHALATPDSPLTAGPSAHQPLDDGSGLSDHPSNSSGPADPSGTTAHSTSTPSPADSSATHSGSAPHQQPPSPGSNGSNGSNSAAPGGGGPAGKLGSLSLKAKVVIGASLLAAAGGGVVVLGQGDGAEAIPTVPLHVQVVTGEFEVTDMPGTPEGPCPSGTGKTDCTKVTQVARGKEGPVQVIPAGQLPKGVAVVYWGCDEGPASAGCTVKADRERTVCATTTSPKDTAARKQCEERVKDLRPSTSGTALVSINLAATDFEVTVTPDTPGGKPCVQPPLNHEATPDPTTERRCEFVVPLGTKMRLAAEITGNEPVFDRPFNGEPVWFGCDEGPSAPPTDISDLLGLDDANNRQTFANSTTTCTLTLDTGRYVGLGSTDVDDADAGALAQAFAQLPKVRIAPGVTTMPGASSEPLQRVPCSSAGGPEDLDCLGTRSATGD